MRHDAGSHPLADSTGLVAFLADLGHLQKHLPAAKMCADRKRCTVDAVHQQVFPERPVADARSEKIEFHDFLITEETDLAVPRAGVRIALIPEHSIFGAEIDVIYSRQGTSSKKWVSENNNTIRYLEKSHYINVPLLLNIYLRKWTEDDEDESMIPRLRIGPQIGFCVGGNEVKEVKINKKQQFITPWKPGTFNRIDYGLTAALSYWFIEVRYTFGMANVFKDSEKSTNHVISVTWSDVW